MVYRKVYSPRHHGIDIYDSPTTEVGFANGHGFFFFFLVVVVVSLLKLLYL